MEWIQTSILERVYRWQYVTYWEVCIKEKSVQMFISRDPLFEKKPWMSPYAYCRNNPLIFIDPNGEDEYEFDKKGKLLNVITNDKADILRIVKADRSGNIKTDKNGNTKTIATSGQYKAGTITSYTKDSKSLTMDIANNESREGMFKFLAGNTKVEWGTISGCENGETGNGAEINKIGTNYENGWTNSLHPYIDDILDRGGVINEYSHSHPSGSIGTPSGYSHASWITPSYGKGDHGVAARYNNLIPNLRVYDADSDTYSGFWKGGHDRMRK